MSAKTARPLPDCSICEQPTKRDVHERTGGLCTSCAREAAEQADTVRILRPGVVDLSAERRRRLLARGGRPPMAEGEQTVFVEAYIPPVPGQLQIELPREDS